MENTKLINFMIGEGFDGSNDIVIRHGEAAKVYDPNRIYVAGILDSPIRWLKHRVIDFTDSTLLVNREKLEIVLLVNQSNEFSDSISGKLVIDERFAKFNINSNKYVSTHDLADLFKMNRSFFSSFSDCNELVEKLRSFKAKVDKEIESSDDKRANVTELRKQTVNSNLPKSFKLFVSLFKGLPKVEFEVEIYIRPDDLHCTLISAEANELVQNYRDIEIDKVILEIKENFPLLVIIEQ